MADVVEFPAVARERAGKGPARAARRAGQVPGVIYGAKKDPNLISVEERLLNKLLHQGDGVHISMVKLPDGVHPAITDRDFTIATIAAPTVVREEAAEAQESAEDEAEEEADDKEESSED